MGRLTPNTWGDREEDRGRYRVRGRGRGRGRVTSRHQRQRHAGTPGVEQFHSLTRAVARDVNVGAVPGFGETGRVGIVDALPTLFGVIIVGLAQTGTTMRDKERQGGRKRERVGEKNDVSAITQMPSTSATKTRHADHSTTIP